MSLSQGASDGLRACASTVHSGASVLYGNIADGNAANSGLNEAPK